MPRGDHNSAKTHCPRGHDYRHRSSQGKQQRYCPTCQKWRKMCGSTAAYDAIMEAHNKLRAGSSIRLGWDDGDDPCEYAR